MATITDPAITGQIQQLAASGQIDTNTLVGIINSGLTAGEQLQVAAGVTT